MSKEIRDSSVHDSFFVVLSHLGQEVTYSEWPKRV